MWVTAPSSLQLLRPEFSVYSGIPASTTAWAAARDALGIGERDGDAVGALGDGRLDRLRLRLGVVVRAEVLDLDAEVLAGLLGGRLDDRPEHAVVTVGDDVEQEVLALHDVDGVAGCRRCRLRRLVAGPAVPSVPPVVVAGSVAADVVVTAGLLGSRRGVGVVVVARAGQRGRATARRSPSAHGGVWFSWMGPPLMLGGW